jgi:hypothetical protein
MTVSNHTKMETGISWIDVYGVGYAQRTSVEMLNIWIPLPKIKLVNQLIGYLVTESVN